MYRFDIINHFIKKYNFKNYLEIGVFNGECIEAIDIFHKDGVDPGVEGVVHPKVNYPITSDEFFELIKDEDIKYDIVFIDGLHHSDQVIKDITNSLKHSMDNPQHKHFVVDDDWGVGVILKNQTDVLISKKDLEKGIDSWDYFNTNRVKLLNLIQPDEFKESYK